jgi:hypothetical protein
MYSLTSWWGGSAIGIPGQSYRQNGYFEIRVSDRSNCFRVEWKRLYLPYDSRACGRSSYSPVALTTLRTCSGSLHNLHTWTRCLTF